MIGLTPRPERMETYDHGPLRGVLAGQPINQTWIAASSGKGDAPDPDADLFAMQGKLAAAA